MGAARSGRSRGGGEHVDASSLGLPTDLVARLTAWNASYTEDELPLEGDGDSAWISQGIELLAEVRRHLSSRFEIIAAEPWWGAQDERGHLPIDEADYWHRLEFRICAEFAGFADRQLRSCWCDGLIPEEYDLAGTEPRISGVAFCGKSGQERWRFSLRLGSKPESPEQIDWAALLPADDLTGWLTPDPQNKTLRIDPRSGYHD